MISNSQFFGFKLYTLQSDWGKERQESVVPQVMVVLGPIKDKRTKKRKKKTHTHTQNMYLHLEKTCARVTGGTAKKNIGIG